MIEYHADDYGLFPQQSRRILNCMENGRINGISIMPNSPYLAECMAMLQDQKPALTVHLNLVEGRAMSPAAKGVLADERGIFNISFGKLLLVSYIPGVRAKYEKVLEDEIARQIRAAKPYYNGAPLRLDGHCHFHMIPVVYDAMMRVIDREKLAVSYIRTPREDLSVYRPRRADLEYTKPINLVKVFLLNRFTRRAERKYPAWFKEHPAVPFAGVYLSGSMTKKNADLIEDGMRALAQQSAAGWAEMLFHPGAVLEDKDIGELTSSDDIHFLTSPMRAKEAEAVLNRK